MYRIRITRTEPNPHFAKEMEQYEARNRFRGMDEPLPNTEQAKDILITEITQEQFEAIRRAVLEKF
jgi:hypothetical protein